MKKLFLVFGLIIASPLFAQEFEEIDIKPSNSWLKLGVTAGVPVGDASDVSAFNLGVDFRGQYLVTPSFAIGVASGYNHYFEKDDFESFGVVPLAGFVRYYFQPKGLFFGSDLGYGFLTNVENNSGGLYVNPQIGYHNRDWNIYGYFQNTFAENDVDVQSVGIGVTYNIRFK
ncbi:hypothetical protein [Flavobacterium okayamense]|uniref:Outer membrane protein beta-barrel domain-containing protein n=1 Tax=Flavobacterium okayamense TaxID=2830782 RepID=A0ABM7S5Y1_9FLAO|nr:hypothetical protein [Flavobacterium okayamense]BCY28986.1 hypothetical protein KK2020170_18540 [Flavobacterium okayamense]